MYLQSLPYEAKKEHAILKARSFNDMEKTNVFCSVGGLDSTTLLFFLRKYVDPYIIGVSVKAIECKENQEVLNSLDNMEFLKPEKSKVEVIHDCGYPIISKNIAGKIELLQHPTEKNACVRNAILTGEVGEYGLKINGGKKNSPRMMLPKKWMKLFAGDYLPDCQTAPFKVSEKCCYYLKEKPCDDYRKQNGNAGVYMGLMASEGGRRAMALMAHGCNYYGKTVHRSCPFAIFSKSDLLRLALELHVPISKAYGEIVETPDGELTTTLATRTGCTMCGFGVHLEERPNRFDRLYDSNPAEWDFWMNKKGWGPVLDYIGVHWTQESRAEDIAKQEAKKAKKRKRVSA